jgi:hypothetical protein
VKQNPWKYGFVRPLSVDLSIYRNDQAHEHTEDERNVLALSLTATLAVVIGLSLEFVGIVEINPTGWVAFDQVEIFNGDFVI